MTIEKVAIIAMLTTIRDKYRPGAAHFAINDCIDAVNDLRPSTTTEIGDRSPTSEELDQLSDYWHITDMGDDIHDSNGLHVTYAEIIRCKVERDNLLQSVRDLMCEFSDNQREMYDACRFAQAMVLDIEAHEEGV